MPNIHETLKELNELTAGGPGSGRHALIEKYHGVERKVIKHYDTREEAITSRNRRNDNQHRNDPITFGVRKSKPTDKGF